MQLLLGIQFWKLHSMNRATVQISVDDANLHFGEEKNLNDFQMFMSWVVVTQEAAIYYVSQQQIYQHGAAAGGGSFQQGKVSLHQWPRAFPRSPTRENLPLQLLRATWEHRLLSLNWNLFSDIIVCFHFFFLCPSIVSLMKEEDTIYGMEKKKQGRRQDETCHKGKQVGHGQLQSLCSYPSLQTEKATRETMG